MNINKKSLNKITWLAIIVAIFLVGCDKVEETYNNLFAEESSSDVAVNTEEQAEETANIDQRFVPELSQVVADFRAREDVRLADGVAYQIQDSFRQTQNNFQLSVDSMQVFEVDSVDESLQSEFNYEDKPGAIMLLEVAITNLTDDTIYYPIEGLRMSYQSADIQMHPSSVLYPSQSGDLMKIFEQNNGEIGPSMTVNGYLVYSFGEAEWEEAQEFGNVYLTVVPPQSESSDISGVGASLLGDERTLYLPLNEEIESELFDNNRMIQDRLSSEWWGDKTLLAQDSLNEKSQDADVTVELLRAEITDFEPRDLYQDNFQNFSYGQIIVSIEYEITNNSDQDLLPVDGVATLQIGDDAINSDYVLINDYNGTILKPGDSYTTIKTFALDKLRYQEVWQGQPIYIALNTPVDVERETDVTDEGLESEQMDVPIYYFDFSWTPNLELFIDTELEIVAENPMQDESVSEEEVTSADESDE